MTRAKQSTEHMNHIKMHDEKTPGNRKDWNKKLSNNKQWHQINVAKPKGNDVTW